MHLALASLLSSKYINIYLGFYNKNFYPAVLEDLLEILLDITKIYNINKLED
jgi:hypothetical protein